MPVRGGRLGAVQAVADDAHEVGRQQGREQQSPREIDRVRGADLLRGEQAREAEAQHSAQRQEPQRRRRVAADPAFSELEFGLFSHPKRRIVSKPGAVKTPPAAKVPEGSAKVPGIVGTNAERVLGPRTRHSDGSGRYNGRMKRITNGIPRRHWFSCMYSEILVLQVSQALAQQRGRGQQYQRHRHLRDHQRLLHPGSPGADRTGGCPQSVRRVGMRSHPSGCQTEDYSRQHRRAQRKQQDRPGGRRLDRDIVVRAADLERQGQNEPGPGECDSDAQSCLQSMPAAWTRPAPCAPGALATHPARRVWTFARDS